MPAPSRPPTQSWCGGTRRLLTRRWPVGTLLAVALLAGSSPALGAFGTPVDLSAAGGNASDPRIAVGPDGATTAVWYRFDGAEFIVQAATRPAGSATFGAPVDLSAAGGNASDPQIAIGPDGAATAVWRRSNGSGTRIVQAATRPAGSATFGTPVDLSATGQNADYPQIAIGPDGAATAVWYRYDGADYLVQAATRPAGSATFGAPVDLSAASGNAYNPQIAIGPDGAATAVWYRYDGTNTTIQAAIRPAGSATFGTPVDLSATGQTADNPQIAIGPDGAATAVWRRSNGSNTIIQAATSPATLARLTVTRSGAGSGSVTSAPPGIDCGLTCSGMFAIGASITLAAQPAAGSVLSSWGGACTGASTTCTVTMTQATSVSATFAVSTPPASTATATAATPRRVGGIIRTRITSTGAGTATVTGTADGRVVCVTRKAFTAPGSAVTTCLPRAWVQRRRLTGPVKVAMTLAFTPSGAATTRTTLRTVTLPKITLRARAVTG